MAKHGWIRRLNQETACEVCPVKDATPMTANAANRVKTAVERVTDKIEKAADDTADRLNQLADKATDKFNQVHSSIADPLEKALEGLDQLLGSNNGPPLDQ